MTKVVYLVIAHTAPQQVRRLAQTLTAGSPHAEVVVHYDANTAPAPGWLADLERVHLVEPAMHGEWGTYGLMALMLHALRWTHTRFTYDWLVLLSGQDYPVKPVAQIEQDLASSTVDGYVRAMPIDGGEPCDTGGCGITAGRAGCGECYRRYRYRFFHMPLGLLLGPEPIQRWHSTFRRINRAQPWLYLRLFNVQRRPKIMLGVRPRHPPFGTSVICYKGSAWWSLHQRAVSALVTALDTQTALVAHYRRTLIPDESLVHTLLYNNPALTLANDDRRFILWSNEKADSPTVLRTTDVRAMTSSTAHFARKFDSAQDAAVLDALDAQIQPEATWLH